MNTKKVVDKIKIEIFPKWLLISVAIFLAVIILGAGFMWAYQSLYQERVYAGVRAGKLDLSGKTIDQVQTLIFAAADQLSNQGIDFVYADDKLNINGIVATSGGAGAAYELWNIDSRKTAEEIFKFGRRGGWWQKIGQQIKLMLVGKDVLVINQLNKDQLIKILKDKFGQYEQPGTNAYLIFSSDKISIGEERSGQVFDYEAVMVELTKNLEVLDDSRIEMKIIVDQPRVLKAQAQAMVDTAGELLRRGGLKISFVKPEYFQERKNFSQTEWWVTTAELKDWLKIKYREHGQTSESENNSAIYLGVDEKKVGEYLARVGETVNSPAKDAKFEISNGRVSEWQSSEDGFVINMDETIRQIESQWAGGGVNNVALILSVDKSKITNENVNDLGIKELVGVGESNFSGSPKNRRHNIQVGVDKLNGLLIKPNEEFSLIEALGEIDAESGYLPELVIKEGRTLPEYGGGLCQIGTTLFRAAINTGLPITERRNHSYRVVYYEPAGTDATIYNPWPDLKFVNDTGDYVLLQTRIEGDSAIFEFWGTKDGRVVTTTGSTIYNVVAAGEPRYIETDELKPGEKKKVESAHSGADAYFKRTISWPESVGREAVEETFSSHYIPWKETWLVGKEAATSTESGL